MLAIFMAVAQATSTPLLPLDAWSVSQADGMCILSRPFGDRVAPVVLAIRQTPLEDDGAEVILSDVVPAKAKRGQTGFLQVELAPSDVTERVKFRRGIVADGGARLTIFDVSAEVMATLPRPTALAVGVEGEEVRSFPLATVTAARGVLRQCNDVLLKRWGIDSREQDLVASPAVRLDRPTLNSANLYPAKAMRERAQGATTVVWGVDTKGRVVDCRAVVSSGHETLDEAACAAVRSVGQYRPAIGHDGLPRASHKTTRVLWLLGNQR